MQLTEQDIIDDCIFKFEIIKTLINTIHYGVFNNEIGAGDIDGVLIAAVDLVTQYSNAVQKSYDDLMEQRKQEVK